MEYLHDTKTLVWYMIGSDRLSKKAKEIILNEENRIYVSSASLWEIAIKIVIGKLDEKVFNLPLFIKMCRQCKIIILPINENSAVSYKKLPLKEKNRDPFDRMIVACAVDNSFTLLSGDSKFEQYQADGLQLLW